MRCKEARLGRGSLVFVRGEPGVGKTRLVQEALSQAETLDMRQASAFCLEHAAGPLGPLADLVQTLHRYDESILTVARSARRVLERLIPELESDKSEHVDVQGAWSQYAAIAEMFRLSGERSACLLVIEDAHWADSSTLEFLKYLTGRLAEMRVVLLVVIRPGEQEMPSLAPLVGELRRLRTVHTLEVGPLSASEMHAFLTVSLGSKRLSHEEFNHVSHLAAGNPLFAEELLTSALAERRGPLTLPASIRETFHERIMRLDVDDREMLITAAVMGPRFDPKFLAAVVERPVSRVLLALRRARSLGLVTEGEKQAKYVVFRHALVREALYEHILIAEARGMHRRILRELETLEDRDRHVAALAYHAWSAAEKPLARIYNELAGDQAMAQLAPNEAAVLYDRALSCAQRKPDNAMLLQIKLGDAYAAAGLPSRAIDVYERAHALALNKSDSDAISRLAGSISREHLYCGRSEAALRWQMEAVKAVENDPGGLSWLCAQAAASLVFACRGLADVASEYIERLEAYAAAVPQAARHDLQHATALVSMQRGQRGDVVNSYREIAMRESRAGNTRNAVMAYIDSADAARKIGEIALTRDALGEAVRIAVQVVVPLLRPGVLADRGMLNLESGAVDIARTDLDNAENDFAGIDSPRFRAPLVRLGLGLGSILADAELIDRYNDERAIEDAFLSKEPWWIAAIVTAFSQHYARTDRAADAQGLIHRALLSVPSIVHCHELAITAAAWGADADLEIARERLTEWARIATVDYRTAIFELFEAYALRRVGRSAAQLGRSAAARFDALGLHLWSAAAYEVAGDRLEAVGRYAKMGCVGEVARLKGKRGKGVDEVHLTRREREVLAYVCDSRSNREIAGAMFVSERTVESHMRAILAKIGGRNRQDIIRIAGQRALR
jgi:DNA-binding CsgD family transcriptional regulator/type II secretory pathway predicted ATPase ExeA/tetratricopeptide (TPR) repeat protein